MKTIPVILNNVSLQVDISIDDSITDGDSVLNTLAEISSKLGDLGEGALIEKLTHILTARSISSISIIDNTITKQTHVEPLETLVSSIAAVHKIKSSGKFQGHQIKTLNPDQLFAIVDLSPWVFPEPEDVEMIKQYREERRLGYAFQVEQPVGSVRFEDDEIPF